MSGGFEAAGDAMTGAVIGRAVEPAHGEAGQHGAGACLNCGSMLAGPYCHVCGQNSHLHRSLMGLWHDIAHGVVHFEGKVWRTLPLLAWNPGDLTRRYIHGERARFVTPLALFLFSVFLMFAVFESVGGPIRPSLHPQAGPEAAREKKADLEKAKAKVATIEAARAAAIAAKQPTGAIDDRLADARADVTALSVPGFLEGKSDWDDLTTKFPEKINIRIGWMSFGEQIKAALKNPKLFAYKMQSSAYKFSWALVPLSLPFMWLMFAWRRGYKLYDHAVFVTYSISAVMLLLVVMALAGALGFDASFALLLIPVHFFWQLKAAYRLSTFGGLWRTIALLFVSFVVLTLFAAALLMLGLNG